MTMKKNVYSSPDLQWPIARWVPANLTPIGLLKGKWPVSGLFERSETMGFMQNTWWRIFDTMNTIQEFHHGKRRFSIDSKHGELLEMHPRALKMKTSAPPGFLGVPWRIGRLPRQKWCPMGKIEFPFCAAFAIVHLLVLKKLKIAPSTGNGKRTYLNICI